MPALQRNVSYAAADPTDAQWIQTNLTAATEEETRMRTKTEVDEEIVNLTTLRIVDGPHKRRVLLSILEAIEELKFGVDTTCEEFSNLSSMEQDAVMQARAWKEGTTAIRPSEGFGKLVVT